MSHSQLCRLIHAAPCCSEDFPLCPTGILIVDDEDDIREVAALSLETVAGWDVVTANSGAQGLIRLSSINLTLFFST